MNWAEVNNVDVQQDFLRINFDPEEQKGHSSLSKTRVGSLKELKVVFITYLQQNKPNILDCQVEAYLTSRGHNVLWTPPYCPELQPIELFWAAGKNNVARLFFTGQKMHDVIQNLQDGWYGTGDQYDISSKYYHKKTDCYKLVQASWRWEDTKNLHLVEELEGKLGSLLVDPRYESDLLRIPIDTLVVNLAKDRLMMMLRRPVDCCQVFFIFFVGF